jgi:hypothetical protein
MIRTFDHSRWRTTLAKKIVGFLPQICNMGDGLNTNFDVDRAAHHAGCAYSASM